MEINYPKNPQPARNAASNMLNTSSNSTAHISFERIQMTKPDHIDANGNWSRTKKELVTRAPKNYSDRTKSIVAEACGRWSKNYTYRTAANVVGNKGHEQIEPRGMIIHPRYSGHIPLEVGNNEHGDTMREKSKRCFSAFENKRRF